MKPTIPISRKKLLFNFCELHHRGQVRKYTGEPYVTHCVAVGKMADLHVKLGYEIGVCHDLLEDTNCTIIMLSEALNKAGYTDKETETIVKAVVELTDVYTHSAYPELNRKKRKISESERMWTISALAQTVKYCDLIDNTKSIVEHDHGFAYIYLREKEYMLSGMTKGNKALYDECVALKDAGLVQTKIWRDERLAAKSITE